MSDIMDLCFTGFLVVDVEFVMFEFGWESESKVISNKVILKGRIEVIFTYKSV